MGQQGQGLITITPVDDVLVEARSSFNSGRVGRRERATLVGGRTQ